MKKRMKKFKNFLVYIFVILFYFIIFTRCSLNKNCLSTQELTKWEVKQDSIYFENKPIAVYDHIEYELNPGHGKNAKPIIELSITQIDLNCENTEKLIKFIHTKHKNQKVEIIVPKNK